MAFFDKNLVFWGASPYQSASDFTSLVGLTATTVSQTINLGAKEDLGVGQGMAQPQIGLYVGTGITCASSGLRINATFQGSSDSVTWTTYSETGAFSTASFAAGYNILPIDLPKRLPGSALPQYYRMLLVFSGVDGTVTVSSGTVLGGILVGGRQDASDTLGLYTSGFTFPSGA